MRQSIAFYRDMFNSMFRFWYFSDNLIVGKLNGFDELKKPVTYIKNGLGCWYTCMRYPGMEPTNNLGVQAMRKL